MHPSGLLSWRSWPVSSIPPHDLWQFILHPGSRGRVTAPEGMSRALRPGINSVSLHSLIMAHSRTLLLLVFCFLFLHPHSEADVPNQGYADRLLEVLQQWTKGEENFDAAGYCAFASGAALSAGYSASAGLHLPVRQALLWPGRILVLSDSTNIPRLWSTFREAADYLLTQASDRTPCLILQPRPFIVTSVDTSLGTPWFIMTDMGQDDRDTVIWDIADLRSKWWRWSDEAGANTIWQHRVAARPALGRHMLQEGMRSLVLSARPDSVFKSYYGLAALAALQANPSHIPGNPVILMYMSRLRELAGTFLTSQLDRWPPGDRDPIKLIAYYFKKDADAWRTLATVSAGWLEYDADQRADWVTAALEWETKTAVALDEIVSSVSE